MGTDDIGSVGIAAGDAMLRYNYSGRTLSSAWSAGLKIGADQARIFHYMASEASGA